MKFNFDKIKKVGILIIVLWLLAEVFIISPIAVSIGEDVAKNIGDSSTVLEKIFINMSSFSSVTKLGKYFVSGKFTAPS